MNLEEYLQALKDCPDERLQEELGIYDNYGILLNKTQQVIANHLLSSGKYERETLILLGGLIKAEGLVHKKGHTFLQLSKSLGSKNITSHGCAKFLGKPDILAHEFRQLRDYNEAIVLHDYSKNNPREIHHNRAISYVVEDIGRFVLGESLQVCLPQAKPEIIYYP